MGGSAVMVGVLEPDALRDESAPVAAAVAEIPLPLGTGLVVAAALAAFGIVASVGLVIDLGLAPALFTAGVAVAGASWHAVVRRGRRDLQDEGVARHLLHRLRQGRPAEEDLQRLQEVGPRPDDHAPELLGEAATEVLPAGTPAGRVLAASAAGVAERLGVLRSDVQQWVGSRRHLSAEPAPGQAVHLVLLDTASQPTVSVAWAPPAEGGDGGHGDEPDGGSSASQGALTVIVAGSEGERARLTRLAALLTSQVGSGEVIAQVPGQHPSGAALRRSFVEDATRRQGGDPVG